MQFVYIYHGFIGYWILYGDNFYCPLFFTSHNPINILYHEMERNLAVAVLIYYFL